MYKGLVDGFGVRNGFHKVGIVFVILSKNAVCGNRRYLSATFFLT
jgi:hypothetical protein